MKKYFFCLFLVILFSACKQDAKNSQGSSTQETPKEFVKTVGNVNFKMIRVEKVKKTTLGKNAGSKARIVSLSAFYIAETEVTQELYKQVMGNNPSFFDNTGVKGSGKDARDTTPATDEVQEKRPVESVSWYEAAIFCNKLTEKLIGKDECVYTLTEIIEENGKIIDAKVAWDFSKKGYRLPTEAEFEYAARGGNEDLVFAGGNYTIHDPTGPEAEEALKEIAWFDKTSDKRTHEVAKKPANGYGLYDMSGNVTEWCNDFYFKPIPDNVEKDPEGHDEDTGSHTCKGGGYWLGGYSQCTVTARSSLTSVGQLDDVGFRVVCRL